jgi:hypothetical protein
MNPADLTESGKDGMVALDIIRALGTPTPRVRRTVTIDFTVTVDFINTAYSYSLEAIPTTQHAAYGLLADNIEPGTAQLCFLWNANPPRHIRLRGQFCY